MKKTSKVYWNWLLQLYEIYNPIAGGGPLTPEETDGISGRNGCNILAPLVPSPSSQLGGTLKIRGHNIRTVV